MGIFSKNRLLRRDEGEVTHVTFVELFYDLVLVFTIIQISTTFSHSFHWDGFLEIMIITLGVWTVWIYTTWHLNWLDPDQTPVRILLYFMMLAGLLLSTAIPDAFADKGLYFAIAYIAMQLGRTLFVLFATKDYKPELHRSMQLTFFWFLISAFFWILGALYSGDMRVIFWGIAIFIELIIPAIGFWVPFVGKTQPKDWNISGEYMAERCGLFVIICLGEIILVNGRTFAPIDWNINTLGAFALCFMFCVAMWSVYFNFGHSVGTNVIKQSDKPGQVALLAYHYCHIPIVFGIIFLAVACEFLLVRASGYVDEYMISAFIGGSMIFLMGSLLFKGFMLKSPPVSHLVGIILFMFFSTAHFPMHSLLFAFIVLVIYSIVIVWEYFHLKE